MRASAGLRRSWILAAAGVGAALSLLLEYAHYGAHMASAPSFCSSGERFDCASVALSKYAVFLGVPVALWGFVGFLAIGLACWQRSRWLLVLALLGTGGALVLDAISIFAIGAFCPLCGLVHLDSFALLFLVLRARRDDPAERGIVDSSLTVLAPPVGILIAVCLFLPRYWLAVFGWEGELPFAHGTTAAGDAWIGATEPKLTLEEFVDYACPHCKAASARNLKELAKHPNALRLVRRYFPLMPCKLRDADRCLGLRVSLCGGEQDRFWQTDRWLFGHDVLGAIDLAQVAHDVGLDPARLADCVAEDRTFERAADAWKQAKLLRIPGAPYYVVNGRIMGQADAASNISELN